MDEYLKIEGLIEGHVYEIRSRNLRLGVWNREKREFVGIREKFGKRYLDAEEHWDCGPPYGTAYPLRDLGPLPEGVSPEAFLGNFCSKTKRPVVWDEEAYHPLREGNKGNFVYVDTRETMPSYPEAHCFLKENERLFAYLETL